MTQKAFHRGTDRRDAGLAQKFERTLAVEMLESQALRTLVLGVTFAVASVFILFLLANIYLRYGVTAAQVPMTVLPVVLGVAIYEFGMRRAIKRHIRLGSFVPMWVWYANACVEISAMSALIIFTQGAFSNPIYVLSAPPLAGYFLFIVLSTLYLDFRLSLFTGCLAAIEYLAIVLFTFATFGSNAVEDSIFLTPGLYIAKTIIVFMGGTGAAFVARELLWRQMASLRAIEERDRQQHANTMKSQFLADMSHEIRTPLNAVIGYAQLLETDAEITPGQRKAVEAIRVSGRHLLAVVNDVLDISKIEAGGESMISSRLDLKALLQEQTLIFAPLCAEKRLSWIFEMKADAGEVVGDEAKLRQVLTNILANAVKFTQNGDVALRVSVDDGDIYRFEIEDTGPGIPEDRHREIFDPFAQDVQGRLKGGTGLGLAIAQRYVGLMGGEIAVHSTPGAGACFRFSLFLPQASMEGLPEDGNATLPARRLAPERTVRALVADDLAANRDILARMLEQAGVTVQTAANGTEALAVIEASPVDIAYLDIRMPGMSGTDVARRISAMGRGDLKIVAVSASALAHQHTEYIDAGFHDFLDKPVQMASLYASLERLLGVIFEDDTPSGPRLGRVTETGSSGGPMVLPEDLRRSLADAAGRHNITDLKRLIAEIETLGAAERIFAAELRDLCGTYDMKAIISALEATGHD